MMIESTIAFETRPVIVRLRLTPTQEPPIVMSPCQCQPPRYQR